MKFITFLTTTLLAILTLSPEAFAQSNPPKCPPGEISVTHLMSQIKSNIMKLYVKDITHIDDVSGCVSKNALNLITTFDIRKIYENAYLDHHKLYKTMEEKRVAFLTSSFMKQFDMIVEDPEYPLIVSDFISLQLPNLQIIGDLAFNGNKTIKDFRHPNILVVGDYAFGGSKLSSVSLPNARIIGDGAFIYCEKLQRVDLPNAVVIGRDAFYQSSVASLKLPNASTIQASAFAKANQLRHLELTTPNSINIGKLFTRTEDIDLVLNKNKSPNGNSSPKATDATHWAGNEWKSITYK
jgi:hypothetical protein